MTVDSDVDVDVNATSTSTIVWAIAMYISFLYCSVYIVDCPYCVFVSSNEQPYLPTHCRGDQLNYQNYIIIYEYLEFDVWCTLYSVQCPQLHVCVMCMLSNFIEAFWIDEKKDPHKSILITKSSKTKRKRKIIAQTQKKND